MIVWDDKHIFWDWCLNHQPVKSPLISSVSTMIHCITIPLYRHQAAITSPQFCWFYHECSPSNPRNSHQMQKNVLMNQKKKNVSRDSRDRDLCTKNRRWRRRSCGRWVVCCSSSSVLADRGEWVVNGLMDDCLMDGQWFKGWFKGEWQSYKLWMEEAIYSMI